MDIKSTAGERLKTYLEGLSEKQRRGILVAMLAFTCVASGIVLLRAAGRLTPARERMELPFGEGSLARRYASASCLLHCLGCFHGIQGNMYGARNASNTIRHAAISAPHALRPIPPHPARRNMHTSSLRAHEACIFSFCLQSANSSSAWRNAHYLV